MVLKKRRGAVIILKVILLLVLLSVSFGAYYFAGLEKDKVADSANGFMVTALDDEYGIKIAEGDRELLGDNLHGSSRAFEVVDGYIHMLLTTNVGA